MPKNECARRGKNIRRQTDEKEKRRGPREVSADRGPLRCHCYMTEKNKDKGDNKPTTVKHNKMTDALGKKYGQRTGWLEYDRSILRAAELLETWLTAERFETELAILNACGKRGRPFQFPPCLILYLLLLKEDDGRPYRLAIAKCQTLLKALGFPIPTYSTLHKSEG